VHGCGVGTPVRSLWLLVTLGVGDEESDEIMVRVKSEGRSKGCQACRKRKIKVYEAVDLKGA
jgi:hypothetical protein